MPRLARIVIEGIAHHVVQRGNNRQDVFFVDEDRRYYLALLKEKAEEYRLDILAYCLMTNHVHLIAVPQDPESLAKAIGRADFLHTQYVNRLQGRSGHLWQNRFHSCALDEGHFWSAMRYVEQNPVRAGLVKEAGDYEWSSAAAHLTGEDLTELLDMERWAAQMDGATWRGCSLATLRRRKSARSADVRSAVGHSRATGSFRKWRSSWVGASGPWPTAARKV